MSIRLVLCVSLLQALGAQEVRTAEVVLREFDGVAMPGTSSGGDAESVRRFREELAAGGRRKAELALELMQGWPEHPRLPEVLGVRWALLANTLRDQDAVIVETSMLLADPALGRELQLAATHARTHSLLLATKASTAEKLRAVRELVAADPEDERTGIALVDLVADHLGDAAMMRPLLDAALLRWPNSSYVARPARRWLSLLDTVGKPFVELVPQPARIAFDLATTERAKLTIVQVWLGWVPTAEGRPEIETLRGVRDEAAGDVALVGMFGEFRGRRSTPEKVAIDWPQIELPATAGSQTPFGAPRLPVYFVLDANLVVDSVVGRATTLAARVHDLRAPSR